MRVKDFFVFASFVLFFLVCSGCQYKPLSVEQLSTMQNEGLMSITEMDLNDCDVLVYEGTYGNQIAIYRSEGKNDIQATKLSGNYSASIDDCISYAAGIKSRVLNCINSGYLSEPFSEDERGQKYSFSVNLTPEGLSLFSSDDISYKNGIMTFVFSDADTFEYFSLILKTEMDESHMYSTGRVPFRWQ